MITHQPGHRPDSAASGYGPRLDNKAEWRRWARQRRPNTIKEGVGRLVVDGLREWFDTKAPPPGTVVIYLPLPDEIDLTPLLGQVDRRFAVTRTPADGPLTLHPVGATLERHRYGFAQPIAGSKLVDPSDVGVVLTPGLVFGRQGERLGRGGGYYDRFFTITPSGTARVGVSPSNLVAKDLPTDRHDVSMTHLATESGVRSIPASCHSKLTG